MSKYIYILDVKFQGLLENSYMYDDIFNDCYYSLDEAIEKGREMLNYSIKRTMAYMDLEYEDILDIIRYSFIIKQVSGDYIRFDNEDDLEKYYNENISKINKENLYDFLMSILTYTEYFIDINGNITSYSLNDNEYLDFRSFEYDNKYHLNKFKVGDKIKLKYPIEGHGPDKVYEIFEVMNKDIDIRNSNDPLHFRQGYALSDIYNDYNNKYSYLAFDEDLIKSSDEEYYQFYKTWDRYDNNGNIIGSFGDIFYKDGKL